MVLSGGAGTRLWPASRQAHPKPFMKLSDGESLLQKTYARAQDLGSEVLTVTNRDYYFMSRDEKEKAGVSGRFLLEPSARNTAPAIALAAEFIKSNYGPETVMLVLAADHLISDKTKLSSAVASAAELANDGYLVTFGIVPTGPETGFGYIEIGSVIGQGNKVARFIEKPDLKSATDYFNSRNYLWNSGMFCFKADTFLNELKECSPLIAQSVQICWRAMAPLPDSDMVEIPEDMFEDVPEISVDYAVMEKSNKVVVVPSSFQWSDVGSWDAVRRLVKPDTLENRALGDAIFVDTHNTFVQSEGRLVATLGVSDLMVIDTPDALLVAHTEKAQDVKKIVGQLKAKNHESFKLHKTVVRPWGTYTILEESLGFKIKRIEVKPGASLSLQMHRNRSEHWVVVSGEAEITNGDEKILIQANESTYIPAGQKHRLENPGVRPCVMIEVQCGSYLGEDDIVRFDDIYGR